MSSFPHPSKPTSAEQSDRRGLPVFPEGTRPYRAPVRVWLVRAVGVLALVATASFLAWRATGTINLAVWWLAVPLFGLELHAGLGLALYAFSLWDLDAEPPCAPTVTTRWRVAVLIPTWNEPEEVLAPTIAAAVALRPAHETWVLDDGDRPAVAALAAALGARYLSRPDRHHAKAGNLNHALEVVDADLVAVLDADHVATPGFLANTLNYFRDPRVALVQTPQDFYNLASFEHSRTAPDDGFNEQSLFYRAIQAGKNRWGAAFWCGTNAVLRVAALRQVGGVATGTVTEDIHTTIRLHRAGWKSIYHNEVLARGLAAQSAAAYLAQRRRWGTGAMQVLRTANPLTGRGLRAGQRLAYAFTLLGWFDAWRALGYLLVPVAVLLTGAVPIRAGLSTFVLLFGATFVAQQLALWLLGRGYHRPWLSVVFDLARMPANLAATLTLLAGGRNRGFDVTPKGRSGTGQRRVRVPWLLWALLALHAAAAGWCLATVAHRTPLHYGVPAAAYAAFVWLLVNAGYLGAAILRIRALRYGGERRASVRFAVTLHGSLDGVDCQVEDLSLSGARCRFSAPPPGDPQTLTVDAPGHPVTLTCVARTRTQRKDDAQVVSVEFLPGQWAEQATLTTLLFNAGIGLEATRAEPVPLPTGRS